MAWLVVLSPWLALLLIVLWDVIRPPLGCQWLRSDRISFATLLFNVIASVGAAIGIVVAFYAYNEARRQADVADDRTKIDQRGQLVADKFAVNRLEAGQTPVASFILSNTGRTPASVYGGRYEAVTSVELPDRFAGDPRSLPRLPGILRQGQESTIVISEYLPPVDDSALREGKVFLYLRITVLYRDIFGTNYEMRATAKYGMIVDPKGEAVLGFEFPEAPPTPELWKATPREFVGYRRYNSHKRIEE